MDYSRNAAESDIDAAPNEQVSGLEIDDEYFGSRRPDVAKAVRDAKRHRSGSKRQHGVIADVDAINLRRQTSEDRRGVVGCRGAVEQEFVQLDRISAARAT